MVLTSNPMNYKLELCYFCETYTTFKEETTNVPVCSECGRIHKEDEIDIKKYEEKIINSKRYNSD